MADNADAASRPGMPNRGLASGVEPVQMEREALRSTKIRWNVLAVYGSGALVENITTTVNLTLLLFYLTIICGLSGAQAGLIVGLTLLIDAVADPIVGSLSDNCRSRLGRRHPFMLASIIPTAIAFGLLFSVPTGLSGAPLFAYALVALLATRVGISFFTVPYTALGAELSDDYAERSNIVAWRMAFNVVGGLGAVILIWGLFLGGEQGRYQPSAYPRLAWTMAVILAISGFVSTLGTLKERRRLHCALPAGNFGAAAFVAEVSEVFRNPSFRSLFISCLILFISQGATTALTLHANTFFWRLTAQQILSVSVFLPVGICVGLVVAGFMKRHFEKRTMTVAGLGLIGLGQLVPVLLRIANIIGPDLAVAVLAASILANGVGACLATIGYYSMMADAADEHERIFGARREGLYFAGLTLSAKASLGLGAWIAGVAVDAIGLPHGIAAAPDQVAKIPAQVIDRLGLIYGPGAALFTALSIAVLMTYKLSKARHSRILAELRISRATLGK